MRLTILATWHRRPPHAHICVRVSPAHRPSTRRSEHFPRGRGKFLVSLRDPWTNIALDKSLAYPSLRLLHARSHLLLLHARKTGLFLGDQQIPRTRAALRPPDQIPTVDACCSGTFFLVLGFIFGVVVIVPFI